DGVADDTAAIQAAITAALAGSRQGGTVYAPLGTYNISSTVTFPDPDGGFQDSISLLGDGALLTRFRWTGATTGFVPMFDWLGQNGCYTGRFLMFNATGAGRAETVGMWLRGDGHTGGTTGGSTIFTQILAQGFSRGILVGDTLDAISELVFLQCAFDDADYGMFLTNYNTLNVTFVLLGISHSTYGIYANTAGSIQTYGGGAALNTTDFHFGSGGAFLMSGFRSEQSGRFLQLVTGAGTV